jgi:hypothetical protein
VLKAGLPILRDFELTTGRYQARLLVRDARGGAIGSVRHTFEVPAAEGFRISTPILSDTLAPGAGGQQIPVPLAHRNFSSGSRVAYAFDVFGATRDQRSRGVSIGYVVRRKNGPIFAESPARKMPVDADGSVTYPVLLSLNGAEPGEYALMLSVEDLASGNRLERTDEFFVDPS